MSLMRRYVEAPKPEPRREPNLTSNRQRKRCCARAVDLRVRGLERQLRRDAEIERLAK